MTLISLKAAKGKRVNVVNARRPGHQTLHFIIIGCMLLINAYLYHVLFRIKQKQERDMGRTLPVRSPPMEKWPADSHKAFQWNLQALCGPPLELKLHVTLRILTLTKRRDSRLLPADRQQEPNSVATMTTVSAESPNKVSH